MSFQHFRNYENYAWAHQGLPTTGLDLIVENPSLEVFYVVRAIEPYRGRWALPGTGTYRPNGDSCVDDKVIDFALRRELGIGTDDLVGKPVRLDWTFQFFEPYYDEQTMRYLQSKETIDTLETVDGSHVKIGRASLSLCAVVKIDDRAVGKMSPDPSRFSDWDFMKEPPSGLGQEYVRHLERYRRLGPYENLVKLFGD